MEPAARERYLATQVLTATPQKLHLMLIEAAIRAGEQARQAARVSDRNQASAALLRAQEIVAELLTGLNREADPALTERLAAVYAFIYRRLVEANVRNDAAKLDDALRILAVERETWQLVCQRLAAPVAAEPADDFAAGPPAPKYLHSPNLAGPLDGPTSSAGFCIDA